MCLVFEGFDLSMIDVGEVTLRVRVGGKGPPLLLLHGAPQTHVTWHLVAPRLAQDFTVVTPDLRGYGDSSKPESTPDHEPYSKRAMARDNVALMQKLGFERFAVAGHDRGGRVGYRLALDHPERVSALATLDIVPTADTFRAANKDFGMGYWHWFFLAQPYPLPEKMIENYPDSFFRQRPAHPYPEVDSVYVRCGRNPAMIHALCEDYRAAATYDFELDEADRGKKRIHCPLLALWGGRGRMGQWFDVLETWRQWAENVGGRALDCGHSLQEEAPDETYRELFGFFSKNPG
jgi:haloacetate dehalogenase